MKILLPCILFLLCVSVFGQNLVPNPDFHIFSSCPQNISSFTPANWYDPIFPAASSDYFHTCSNSGQTSIPNNFFGFQDSDTGQAYAGLITYLDQSFYREYIQVELPESLIAGGCYEVKMTYNRGDIASSSNNLGLAITVTPPNNYLTVQPQLEVTTVITDTENWNEEVINFVAEGGERFVTIGNFRNDANTTYVPDAEIYAYYYIDFVSIEYNGVESEDVIVELGDDLTVCEADFPLTLTSNNPGAINTWSTGESGPSIEVTSGGVYYLTINEDCEFGIDSVEIFVLEDVEFELEDVEFCEGESYTFDLDESLGEYEWGDGSTDTDYTITEGGTYSVALTSDCGIIDQTIEVTTISIINLPFVEDILVCEDDLPIIVEFFDFDDGVNQFDWSTGSTESLIFVTESGEYDVLVFNECSSDLISFEVVVDEELPNFITYNDTLICPGEQKLINTGLDGDNTEIIWQDGSTESFYLVEGPGTYTLTASNSCDTKEYTFVIVEASEFVLDLGEDIALCPGDSVLLTSPLDDELLWNGSIVADEIWIKEAGTITAEYTGLCNEALDTIVISFNGMSPMIDLVDSVLLCLGDSVLISGGSNDQGVNYSWNTGSVSNSIYASESGVYTVVGTNSCGFSEDSVVVYTEPSLPEVMLENLYIFCEGDTLTLNIDEGNAEILWSTGAVGNSVELTEEGIYNVALVNNCESQDVGFVLQYDEVLEEFDLGDDLSICEGESVEINGPTADGIYLWNTEEISESIEVSAPGVYILEIEGVCNTVIDSLSIIDLGSEPTVELGDNVEICSGDSIELVPTNSGDADFMWSTGEVTETIQVFEEGTYVVEVTNACGTDIDSLSVIFNNAVPQIDLGFDTQICEGDSILLDVGSQSGTITWNTGDIGEAIYATEQGWYEATLTSSCGESNDSIYISTLAAPSEVNLGMDTTICEGSSYEIILDDLFFFDVEWQNGDFFPSQTIDAAQLYWINVSNSCGEVSDSLLVDFHPTISPFAFDPVDELCKGDTVFLDGFQENVVSFTWQDNSNASNFTVTESGLYSLEVEGICETFSAEIEINYIPEVQLESEIDPFYVLCEGEELEVDLFNSAIDGILWDDESTDFERTFTEAGTYIFQLFNICQDSTYSFELSYEDCISDLIYIPNVFTPNDDGNNDVFGIVIPEDWIDPVVRASIYNRWGERIFYSEERDFTWNGQFKQRRLNPGVYVYNIEIAVEIEGELKELLLQGDVTILR